MISINEVLESLSDDQLMLINDKRDRMISIAEDLRHWLHTLQPRFTLKWDKDRYPESAILQETDLMKNLKGKPTLDYLILNNNTILLKEFDGVPIFIEKHAKAKAENRFVKNADIRHKFITLTDNYIYHIKDIIETTSKLYTNSEKFQNRSLFKDLSYRMLNMYPKIENIKTYDDEKDDISYKLALYRLVKKDYLNIDDNPIYMIESALAISTSFLSYNYQPLAYLRNLNNDKWKEFLQFNNESPNSIVKPFLDLDTIDITKPIINICSYTSWFKHIADAESKIYVRDGEFNQSYKYNDVYVNKTRLTKGYVFAFPLNNDIIEPITNLEFNVLKNHERFRDKSE